VAHGHGHRCHRHEPPEAHRLRGPSFPGPHRSHHRWSHLVLRNPRHRCRPPCRRRIPARCGPGRDRPGAPLRTAGRHRSRCGDRRDRSVVSRGRCGPERAVRPGRRGALRAVAGWDVPSSNAVGRQGAVGSPCPTARSVPAHRTSRGRPQLAGGQRPPPAPGREPQGRSDARPPLGVVRRAPSRGRSVPSCPQPGQTRAGVGRPDGAPLVCPRRGPELGRRQEHPGGPAGAAPRRARSPAGSPRAGDRAGPRACRAHPQGASRRQDRRPGRSPRSGPWRRPVLACLEPPGSARRPGRCGRRVLRLGRRPGRAARPRPRSLGPPARRPGRSRRRGGRRCLDHDRWRWRCRRSVPAPPAARGGAGRRGRPCGGRGRLGRPRWTRSGSSRRSRARCTGRALPCS